MERLGGVDVELHLVVVPPVLVESVPFAVDELVGVAIVEPVLVAPDPGALFEAFLGGAPVMPLALVPSVPDAIVVRPLFLGDLGAGLADFATPLVVLDERSALALGGEDLGILSGNLMVVLESGVGDVPVPTFLQGEQGVITKLHEVLALLIHFFFGGCAGHHL